MLLLPLLAGCPSPAPADVPAAVPACAAAEIWDGEACVPEACGAAPWGDAPTDADTVYVDAAAPADGDGSAAYPFATVQAGADAASARGGGSVRLAAGTYLGAVVLDDRHDGVEILGRCADRVSLDGDGVEDTPTVSVYGTHSVPTVHLAGVTITGGAAGGLSAATADVWVSDSLVRANKGYGARAWWAGLTLDGVSIDGTEPGGEAGNGWGLWASTYATVTVRWSRIEGNTAAGVFVWDTGTSVVMEDSAVRDTQPDDDGDWGSGLSVNGGGTATLTRSTISGSHWAGVEVWNPGSAVTLADTEVTDTATSPAGDYGYGIALVDGARLTVASGAVRRAAFVGLAADDGTTASLTDLTIEEAGGVGLLVEGAEVHAEGLLIRDTVPAGPDTGAGVEVSDGGEVELLSSTIDGNHFNGLSADGAGTLVALIDSTIHGTGPDTDGTDGNGVVALDGATVQLTRTTLSENTNFGLGAGEEDTRLEVVDSEVRDTKPSPAGGWGAGILVVDGATLTVTGGSVDHNTAVGVSISGPSTQASLTDVEIARSVPVPEGLGRGAEADAGATMALDGVTLRENTEIAVAAAASEVTMTNSFVTGTRRGAVTGVALGLNAWDDATIDATGGAVSQTEGPGLYVVSGGTIRFHDGTLDGNTFAQVLLVDGTIVVTGTSIGTAEADAELGGGFGVYANGRWGAPALTLTDSSVAPQIYAAAWFDGAGRYDLEGNDLSGGEGFLLGNTWVHGNAVLAEGGVGPWDGEEGLRLVENHVGGSGTVAVLLHASSATLDGNTWSDNPLDVVQQHCGDPVATLGEADLSGVPSVDLCPARDHLIDFAVDYTSLYLPDVAPEL